MNLVLKNVINRKDIVMIFLLAIYNFCFLGTEYFFDDMMATLTDSAGVVTAQNIILGVSFIGVIVYPVFCKYISDKMKRIVSVNGLHHMHCLCVCYYATS